MNFFSYMSDFLQNFAPAACRITLEALIKWELSIVIYAAFINLADRLLEIKN
jgi:hypothetical protein